MPTADDVARRIVAQHADRERFEPLAPELQDLSFAYAVQDRLIEIWAAAGRAIAGWKIGLTTPRMQAMCGVSQPILGAIFADSVFRSGHVQTVADHVRAGLEMELAVEVGDALPADATRAGAAARIAALAASYELIEDRAADYATLDACSLVADNSWNAGIVLGEPTSLPDLDGLLSRQGTLELDGAIVDRGLVRDAGGDPIEVVAWAARTLAARGHQIKAGQWIMTGSLVPTRFPRPGEQYRFTIDGLDPVVLDAA